MARFAAKWRGGDRVRIFKLVLITLDTEGKRAESNQASLKKFRVISIPRRVFLPHPFYRSFMAESFPPACLIVFFRFSTCN